MKNPPSRLLSSPFFQEVGKINLSDDTLKARKPLVWTQKRKMNDGLPKGTNAEQGLIEAIWILDMPSATRATQF